MNIVLLLIIIMSINLVSSSDEDTDIQQPKAVIIVLSDSDEDIDIQQPNTQPQHDQNVLRLVRDLNAPASILVSESPKIDDGHANDNPNRKRPRESPSVPSRTSKTKRRKINNIACNLENENEELKQSEFDGIFELGAQPKDPDFELSACEDFDRTGSAAELSSVKAIPKALEQEIKDATDVSPRFTVQQGGHYLVENYGPGNDVSVYVADTHNHFADCLPHPLWNPDKKHSCHFTEFYGRDRLVTLCQEWPEFCEQIQSQRPDKIWNHEAAIVKLRFLLKRAPFGVIKDVRFEQIGAYGRLYARSPLSLCKMSGFLRDSLIAFMGWDADIVNCHWTFVLYIIKRYNFVCSSAHIQEYVTEHKAKRIEIARRYFGGDSKEDIQKAKDLLITILYGGGLSKLRTLEVSPDSWIGKLYIEMVDFTEELWATYPSFQTRYAPLHKAQFHAKHAQWKDCGELWDEPTEKDPKASGLALILQDLEHTAISRIIELVHDAYDSGHKVALYMFDGAVFLRPEGVTEPQFQQKLNAAAAQVNREFGMSIRLNIKPAAKDLFALSNRLSEFIPPSPAWMADRIHIAFNDITELSDPAFLSSLVDTHGCEVQRVELADADGQRYLPSTVSQDMAVNDTVLIKGPMAAGKTHALYDFLCSLQITPNLTTVQFITFRRSLAAKYLDDLEMRHLVFESYLDITERSIDAAVHGRGVTQINSIARLCGDYHVLILDEASYIFDMIFYFCKDRAAVVLARFLQYIRSCKHLVVMDAFLNSRHLSFFLKQRPLGMKVIYATGNRLNKTVYFCDHRAWQWKFIKLLKAHKRIFVVTNNKKFIFDPLERVISEVWPNARVLCVTADLKPLPKISEFGSYDVVIISPVMAAGLSFDDPPGQQEHFYTTFMFATNGSASAEILSQQALRVRRTQTDEIYIAVQNYPGLRHHRWDDRGIEKFLVGYQSGHFSEFVDFSVIESLIEPSDVSTLLKDAIRRRMQSDNNMTGRLTHCLREQGFRVSDEWLRLPCDEKDDGGLTDFLEDDDSDDDDSDESDVDSLSGHPLLFSDVLKAAGSRKRESPEVLRGVEDISVEQWEALLMKRDLTAAETLLKRRFDVQKFAEISITNDAPPAYVLGVVGHSKNVSLLEYAFDLKKSASTTRQWAWTTHSFHQRRVRGNAASLVHTERDIAWQRLVACKLVAAVVHVGDEDNICDVNVAIDEMKKAEPVYEAELDQLDCEYNLCLSDDDLWKILKALLDGPDGAKLRLIKAVSDVVYLKVTTGEQYERVIHTVQRINKLIRCVNRSLQGKELKGGVKGYRLVTAFERDIQNSYNTSYSQMTVAARKDFKDVENTRLANEFCKY